MHPNLRNVKLKKEKRVCKINNKLLVSLNLRYKKIQYYLIEEEKQTYESFGNGDLKIVSHLILCLMALSPSSRDEDWSYRYHLHLY